MSLFSYGAYGLTLNSTLALPELRTVEPGRHADVLVRMGHVEYQPPEEGYSEGYIRGTPQQACIVVEQVGAFLVRGGREIVVDPDPAASGATLRIFILGGALGLLLQQRGLLTLHASAVATPTGAVVFLGASGAGKSTMAAAMHKRSYLIVADDVTALDVDSAGAVTVLPSFPRLKVWPDVATELGYGQETLNRFHEDDERRHYCAIQGFADAPLPLSGVYVLADATNQSLERLSPQDAFAELLGYSYAAGLLGEAGATPTHLHQCAMVAGRVPVYRFKRPCRLMQLQAQARLMDEHIQETAERDHVFG